MKKTDIQNMLDGISEEYIAEAIKAAISGEAASAGRTSSDAAAASAETAAPGKAGPEKVGSLPETQENVKGSSTPFFLTKRAILALTAVAAVTIFAVGMILKEAFPKDSIRKPSDSGSGSSDLIDSNQNSEPIEEYNRDNYLGGNGDLIPICGKGTYNTFAAYDDDCFYLEIDGVYYCCDINNLHLNIGAFSSAMYGIDKGDFYINRESLQLPDVSSESDSFVFQADKLTSPLTEVLTQPTRPLFTDGTTVYQQHDGGLYCIENGNERCVADFGSALMARGNEAAFVTESLWRTKDCLYICGKVARNAVIFSVDLDEGTVRRESFTGVDSTNTGYGFCEYRFAVSTNYVWYFNDEGKLCFRKSDEQTDTVTDLNTDNITTFMENGRVYALNNYVYYIRSYDGGGTDGISAALMRFSAVTLQEEQMVSFKDYPEQFRFCGNEFYLIKNIIIYQNDTENTGSDYSGSYGIIRYSLGMPQTEHPTNVIASEYMYAASPDSQFGLQPLIILGGNDNIVIYRDGDVYAISNQNNFTSYYYVKTSDEEERIPLTLTGAASAKGVTVKLRAQDLDVESFSPRFVLSDAHTGAELPRSETETLPIADGFADSEKHYAFPANKHNSVYLRLEWQQWYGVLAPGTYTLTLYTYRSDETMLPLSITLEVTDGNSVILHTEESGTTTVEESSGTETTQTTAERKRFGNINANIQLISDTGCIVVLTNESAMETAPYSKAYSLYYDYEAWEGATGTLCAGGEKAVFEDQTYELEPGKTIKIPIQWQDFYGKLPDGDYIIELDTKDRFGENISFHFTLLNGRDICYSWEED